MLLNQWAAFLSEHKRVTLEQPIKYTHHDVVVNHVPSSRSQHQDRNLIDWTNSVKFSVDCLINVVPSHNLVSPCWTVTIIKIDLQQTMTYSFCSLSVVVSATWIPWTLAFRARIKWFVLAGETSPKSNLLSCTLGGTDATRHDLSSRDEDFRNSKGLFWRIPLALLKLRSQCNCSNKSTVSCIKIIIE